MTASFPQPVRIALGSAALLAAGVLIGRVWFGSGIRPAESPGFAAGAEQETRIANVRFQHLPGGADSIAVQYDQLTPVRIAGTLQDPAVQKALLRAVVTDENAGVRLRAVTTLAFPASVESDREVKAALIVVLGSDPNAGVRKQAMQALRRFPYDDAIKNALINTLMHDQNPGLRVDAINSLDSVAAGNIATDSALLDALRKKAARDENTYVQWKARAVLREAKLQ
jgi:HEAT repeat protein